LYDVATYGDVRLLHTCDIHAQLSPIYFREPHVNLGLHSARGKPPHLVGDAFLKYYNIASGSPLAHATTYLGMEELAARYGKAGGLAHLAHLIRQLRESYGTDKTMLLDSGDMWHGSATALYTMGADMVEAANLLGIDVITGHWEFTYPAETLRTRIKEFNGVFLAQNVFVKEDALFEGAEAYDEDSGLAFQPWVMRELGGRRIAVIGQAFPYTPIANPQRFIPDWTFGVRRTELQTQVEHIRANEKPDAVVLLSHNGADLDAQIAADVRGIDFILGGHTHDIFCQPRRIDNTMVFNSGCSGKFVGCLDIAFDSNGISDFHYHLLPVFANALPTDRTMAAHIETVRTPYAAALGEKLAIADETLYRRGNFNGTMDQVILDSLRSHYDAQIALSPGFRWGPSVLAGDAVRMEDVMNVTATTYPETYVREMHGEELKTILESVADNLYHPDPYYQQGGDMVRVGGMDYTLEPTSTFGTRIADMRLDSGKSIEANKRYTVAGWSTANPSDGPPMWEIMASYLRTQKTISVKKVNLPKLKGVANNSGIADYPKNLLVT
jgi:sulfur-oxidizing protein SoxB